MKKYLSWKLLAILIVTLVLGFFDVPAEKQGKILPTVPDFFQKSKIHLGLDLQGGSQLDYKIDLRKVPESDKESITQGVQEVIERRVNRLGVAEPNIFRSTLAGETHIIVELAETAILEQEDIDTYLDDPKPIDEITDDERKLVSLEKAKATVGKTIQLEFKEEKGELDPQEKEKVQEQAQAALDKIKEGANYSIVGQEEQQAYPGKVSYDTSEFTFVSELPPTIKEALEGLEIGQHTDELVEITGDFVLDPSSGQAIQETGLAILKLADTTEEIRFEKEVDTSHILISWEGLDSADATITRSEDEAYTLAKEVVEKFENSNNFSDLAKEFSDDSSNKELGGKLTTPVTGDGTYVFDFEEAALALEEVGDVTEITKTQFGYHIIKADAIRADVKEKKYKYESISYSTKSDPWKDTGLTGEHFVRADVQLDSFFQSYVSIQFNDEGGNLFEEITERNVGKPIAIFVGGDLISAPNVNEKISGGSAQITGQFSNEEAQALARDLNTGAIPAPIVLTGEYTIGATLGQEALSKSLWAGFIGLILVMIFMLIYYRLPGLVANAALFIYGVILLFLIKAELHLGIALGVSLIIFGFLVTKIVNNKDSGWEKLLSFVLSCFGFFFLTFLLKTGVVITLAGIAGIILSIGMAVDANILIFERLKEELRAGKTLGSAIDSGFHRAWSAIRDSNFSTLLTCAILFYFGSSIIRGFAFNLAAGILVSMFTAITITRTLLYGFVGKKIAENMRAFGVKEKRERTPLKFIKKSKVWFSFSGLLIAIAVISMFAFGLNLGIDFKGGTLLEFRFEEEISKETLANTLKEIEENKDSAEAAEIPEVTPETTTDSTEEEPMLRADKTGLLDLSGIKITESGENSFIVKTKYLTSETHDQLIDQMRGKLPKFTEPRFTTIGPVIGKTLLHKAVIAIIFALVMIIVYVAFAFRKIPKEVSPWRFGATAIVALLHDVIIVTGVFVILGQFLSVEIDALFITAMLTVFGYSVNDTIVVLDRLRENLIHGSNDTLAQSADKALSQTLARSINTSVSTLITLIAVLLWGSPTIFYFVLALTIGTAIGTYSSIFLATPLLVNWNTRRRRKHTET